LYAAARLDHLGFSTITGAAGAASWEAPVSRVEVGGGYSIVRNLQLKLSFQRNNRPGRTRQTPAVWRRSGGVLVLMTRGIFILVLGALLLASGVPPHAARNGSVRGRVELRRVTAAPEPRSADHLGAAIAPDSSDRRRSVVYLEAAPRGAFEQTEAGRAVMDQRNETFVPHVLAITTGTTVSFPNSDRIYHNVFSLSRTRSFDLVAMRLAVPSRSASTGPASSGCSAIFIRT
jgi:plastocyanin